MSWWTELSEAQRQKHKDRQRAYYVRNKEKFHRSFKFRWAKYREAICKAIAKRKSRNVDFINAVKSIPCADCHQSFPPTCMDFDHLDATTKLHSIATMLNYSINAIKKEISKCEVVCSNCHRLRTQNRRKCA